MVAPLLVDPPLANFNTDTDIHPINNIGDTSVNLDFGHQKKFKKITHSLNPITNYESIVLEQPLASPMFANNCKNDLVLTLKVDMEEYILALS